MCFACTRRSFRPTHTHALRKGGGLYNTPGHPLAPAHLPAHLTPVSPQLPQSQAAGDLDSKARALEQKVASRERAATEAARALQTSAQVALRGTEPLAQVST